MTIILVHWCRHGTVPFRRMQYDQAIPEYEKAVELQAGYVTAWNNLGDAYEATKQWR